MEIAAILALAAIVRYVPGSGHGTRAVEAALSAAFAGALIWTFARAYKVRRWSLLVLPPAARGALYFSLAGFVSLLAAAGKLWHTTAGELGFWIGIGIVAYLLLIFYRHARRY